MELRLNDGLTTAGWPLGQWRSMFDVLDGRSQGFAPRADVVEDESGYHFYFDMAGISPESIEARVEDGSLLVEAERKRPEWKDASLHVAERAYGKLSRAFELPEDALHDGIAASYRNGVLEVTVPKRPESKPVKIKVNYEN
ncbi:MAG TPA: Hsp20/alpha crystallin family protein [Candidatus Binataceae bacterium]|nr:Hsp20/alpha crystallin family protein [Candidatus Binataceae bacterium]